MKWESPNRVYMMMIWSLWMVHHHYHYRNWMPVHRDRIEAKAQSIDPDHFLTKNIFYYYYCYYLWPPHLIMMKDEGAHTHSHMMLRVYSLSRNSHNNISSQAFNSNSFLWCQVRVRKIEREREFKLFLNSCWL